MARMYGKVSSYLVKSEKFNTIFALIYLCTLGFIWYFIFIKNFQRLLSLVGIITFTIFLGPFAWYGYREYKKHNIAFNNFRNGRKGEGAIWYELKNLSDEFLVFQDVKIGEKGNMDFVVLGPTGLFTIEVKSHRGKIDFNGKELTINNHLFQEKDVLKQSMSEALTLHDYLKEKLIEDIFVHPVLVFSSFWARMHFGLKPINNIFVIQKRFLRKLIYSSQKIYSPDIILKIENKLKTTVSK